MGASARHYPLALHCAACCGELTAAAPVARAQTVLKRSCSSAALSKWSGRCVCCAQAFVYADRSNDPSPQRQLASCHQRSGPEASSTCPPQDLWSILRRRLTEHGRGLWTRGGNHQTHHLVNYGAAYCTHQRPVPNHSATPILVQPRHALAEKTGGSEGLVLASAPLGGALHPSDQPQVARARRRHLRKHAPTKMQ